MSVPILPAVAIPGYDEFELDVERVLRDRLPSVFGQVEPAQLTRENVQALPAGAKGAYLLIHQGKLAYAGKTDTRHGFRDRLDRHFLTIQHRVGLNPDKVEFKALRIMVFSNFDVEAILIDQMRTLIPGSLEWNDSGFGSNDPGHNRERQEPAAFDTEYPVDIDRELDFIAPGIHSVPSILQSLKGGLPYLLRFQSSLTTKRPKGKKVTLPEEPPLTVNLAAGNVTTRRIMEAVIEALPGGEWQATIFPDRVVLYKEREDYPYARSIIR